MAIFKITTSANFTPKLADPGFIRAISCPNAGTTWTLQINDGPRADGTTGPLFGTSTLTTGIALLAPLYFSHGVQIVTTGASPGELDLDII